MTPSRPVRQSIRLGELQLDQRRLAVFARDRNRQWGSGRLNIHGARRELEKLIPEVPLHRPIRGW
jgi:hypothetical protein